MTDLLKLHSTVAELKSRLFDLEKATKHNNVAIDTRFIALEAAIFGTKPTPVVEPTGYEEMDSDELLTEYTIGHDSVSRDSATVQNMRREILIRMQQGQP